MFSMAMKRYGSKSRGPAVVPTCDFVDPGVITEESKDAQFCEFVWAGQDEAISTAPSGMTVLLIAISELASRYTITDVRMRKISL